MKDLIAKIKKARFVFVCGNGGSASTAEHLTCDLFSKGIQAICLNSNVSTMTMIANDFGYKYVFGKQLELFSNSDDLLITISCSGTSPNILYAQKIALQRELSIFSFETFGKDRDYEALEDRHMKFAHKIKKLL
jgi:D-sedoheptulose 7-phosphate isomerase